MNQASKKQRYRLFIASSTVIALCVCIIAGFLYFFGFWPARVETVRVHSRLYVGKLENKNSATIMTYNVKFMQSNENNYYFNGESNDTWLTRDTIIATINNIAKIIDDSNPDIILLQEVDIRSKRTFKINQIQTLLNKISGEYQYWACTPYWKSRFIPKEQIWGKMDMELCTISKYPIKAATRYALPNIDTANWLNQQFLPKRAVLATTITMNNHNYQLYNLHLSPHGQHNKAVNPQLKILENLIASDSNTAFIVGGDFNMLADKKFLSYLPINERQSYQPEDVNFKQFFRKYHAIPPLEELSSAKHEQYFTFMGGSLSDTPPDRTIDYFFLPQSMKVIKYEVVKNDLTSIMSDHLPLLVTVTLE